MMLSFEENVRAILECNFAGMKDEFIDIATQRIVELQPQKTGVWLMPDKYYSPKIWRKCSACGKHIDIFSKYDGFNGVSYTKRTANYCNVCGAKMEYLPDDKDCHAYDE